MNRTVYLEQRLQISENNLELARKMLQKTNEINIEKDMKIRYLEKKNKEIFRALILETKMTQHSF